MGAGIGWSLFVKEIVRIFSIQRLEKGDGDMISEE